jgi:signal transduction histidine kinase
MVFYQVTGEILNETTNDLVGNFNVLITILQALGGVIVVYILFNIIMVVINRKRNKKIFQILNEVSLMKRGIISIDKNIKEIKDLLSRQKGD